MSPQRLVRGRAGAEDRWPGPSGCKGPGAPGSDEARIDRLIAERTEARGASGTSSAPTRSADEIERLGAILEDKAGRHRVEVEGAVSDDRVWGRNPVLRAAARRRAPRRRDRGARRRAWAARRGRVAGAPRRREGVLPHARSAHRDRGHRRSTRAWWPGSPRRSTSTSRTCWRSQPSGGEPPFFVALDQVQDPRNFGALLRTADAFGVHGVIVPKHHAVGLTDAAARTAMGAVEYVSVARETNLVTALEKLKESGVWVYGASPTAGMPPWAADLTGPRLSGAGERGGGAPSAGRQDVRRAASRSPWRGGSGP